MEDFYNSEMVAIEINVFNLDNFLREHFGEGVVIPNSIIIMDQDYVIGGKGPIYDNMKKDAKRIYNYLKNLNESYAKDLNEFTSYAEHMALVARTSGMNKKTTKEDLRKAEENFSRVGTDIVKFQRTGDVKYLFDAISVAGYEESEIEKEIRKSGLSDIIDERFMGSFLFYREEDYGDHMIYRILDSAIGYYKTLQRASDKLVKNQEISFDFIKENGRAPSDEELRTYALKKKLAEVIDLFNKSQENEKMRVPKDKMLGTFERVIEVTRNVYNLIDDPESKYELIVSFPLFGGGFYDPEKDILGVNDVNSTYHEILHAVGKKSNNKYLRYLADDNEYLAEFSTRIIENAFIKHIGLKKDESNIITVSKIVNVSDDPYESADLFTVGKSPEEIVKDYKRIVDSEEIEQFRK